MESNKDEALRSLAIAQKHRDANNIPAARKFCLKSINLFSTPEALKLLSSLNAANSPSSSSGTNGSFTSSTETNPSASGAKHRSGNGSATGAGNGTAGGIGGEKREYTPEQHAVVKRVRACKVTEYYEILAVKKECEESDIKKAYRRLALALHPDKNGAPGADEAFKLVSKAFQVLSDPQKRAAYDRHGSDPEDRFNMSSRSSGFATSPFSGGRGELSPEDLFDLFFGGAGGGAFNVNGFGGGPVFTTTFGPGGFRTTRMGRPPQARENRGEAQTARSGLLHLLPFLLLFAFSILSALPSLFNTSTPDPRFSFTPTSRYNVERRTGGMGVRYHVNGPEFSAHPQIAADLAAGSVSKRGALSRFEGSVERVYTQDLYNQCQLGLDRRERRKEAEIGVFGFGTDWDKVREIEKESVESCEELKRLGVLR